MSATEIRSLNGYKLNDETARSNVEKLRTESQQYTDTKISQLINSAPTTLDTLGEIAAAMAENATVVEALDAAIGQKASASDLSEHIFDKSNPHGVTAEQIGAQPIGPKYSLTFIDQVNGYTYIACMRNGNFVTYCAAHSIEITTMPEKTAYTAGEYFDPTGMVVTAIAQDGTSREIIEYTYSTNVFTENTTSVDITYIEDGVTHTVTVPIVIKSMADVLVDFNYNDNGNGTYTITSWKGTYNGEPSTEIIVPNHTTIIV